MADSAAFPGVNGALEKTSYGVSGDSGDPAAKTGPSGGTVPGPRVLSETNVECASTLTVMLFARGDAEGEGDGSTVWPVADTVPAIHQRKSDPRSDVARDMAQP